METNATELVLAAELATARKGTFTGIIGRRRGETRGRGAEQKTYGNDLVHDVVVTGFRYDRLVTRSKALLTAMTDETLAAAVAGKMGLEDKVRRALTLADAVAAREALIASCDRVLSREAVSTNAHVFEPLTVDGVRVRGSKVYRCVANDPSHVCRCRECTDDAEAPTTGQINVSGLLIATRILEAAPNGLIPPSASSVATVAKNVLDALLPSSRYVSYRFRPGDDFVITAGGAAAVAATANGVTTNPVEVAETLDLLST